MSPIKAALAANTLCCAEHWGYTEENKKVENILHSQGKTSHSHKEMIFKKELNVPSAKWMIWQAEHCISGAFFWDSGCRMAHQSGEARWIQACKDVCHRGWWLWEYKGRKGWMWKTDPLWGSVDQNSGVLQILPRPSELIWNLPSSLPGIAKGGLRETQVHSQKKSPLNCQCLQMQGVAESRERR